MKPAPKTPAPKAPEMPQRMAPPVAAAPAEPAPAPDTNDVVRPAPTPDLNPRNRAAAEIAARANADADVAATESVPEGDGETMPVSAAPAAAAPETPADSEAATPEAATPTEPEQAPAAAAPALPGIDPNAEYDFMVDGVKTKIRGSQVIARVQKGETADYRLEIASKLLEEAKRTVTPQLPAQGAAPQAPAAPQPAALDDAQLAQLIQFGTQEQAAEALRQLRAQRPDTVTKEGLREFMAQIPRLLDQQLAFREGVKLVQTQYNDLIEDPDMRQLFFAKENAARAAGDKRTPVELYKDIGDGLRKRFNLPAPATTPATATAPTNPAAPTIAQKQAAKAAAPAAPRLAAARLEGGSDAQKPKTREEIINGMRQARGQNSLAR